jgi:hypothetical protein
MKKSILALTLILGSLSFVSFTKANMETALNYEAESLADPFCEGWEDGYCDGWKDVKGPYSYCPVYIPMCPLPEWGQETYKAGYIRGFKAGYRAAQN